MEVCLTIMHMFYSSMMRSTQQNILWDYTHAESRSNIEVILLEYFLYLFKFYSDMENKCMRSVILKISQTALKSTTKKAFTYPALRTAVTTFDINSMRWKSVKYVSYRQKTIFVAEVRKGRKIRNIYVCSSVVFT